MVKKVLIAAIATAVAGLVAAAVRSIVTKSLTPEDEE